MTKRNLLKIAILAIALAGLFLFVQASKVPTEAETCKESLDKNPKDTENGGTMPWENPVHQFISTF